MGTRETAPAVTGARHAGRFVLRTPFLPFAIVSDLSASLEAPAAEPADRPGALARDRSRIRDRLAALVESAPVLDAIYVASPDLYRAIAVWRAAPDSERGLAVERALFRYVTRMATRATPFGLFAGTGVGAIGGRTTLALAPQSSARRHTRLDMDYLVRLTEALARDAAVQATLRFAPNTSLHRVAGRWHYVETRLVNDTRSHQLVAVDDTEALDATFARAAFGATRDALADALVDDEITQAEARGYIDELIASQLLVPEFECAVTGPEPLPLLIAALGAQQPPPAAAGTLAAVAADLAQIDADGVGADPARYDAVAERLAGFDVKIEPGRLLQVDMVRPTEGATLSDEVVRDIAAGVDLLHRISPLATDEGLARLRAAFRERYDLREVPLVEMLDDEAGIGSALSAGLDRDASALLQDVHFPDPAPATVPWTAREAGLLRRVGAALMAGHHELALSPRDLEELAAKDPLPLPAAFAVVVTLCGDLAGPGDRGLRILLQGVSGPSGATLLGRFCLADPTLHDVVRAHIAAEEALDPDAIYAEIVHLPEGRIGNILMRPTLRRHEIVYLGRSGLPRPQQIPVTDLLVSLSGNRFVLRSARLGRRIVPRLTSAHNFMRHAVGMYRFLCLVQSDGCTPGAAWQWGALESLPFLPRVTAGRLVLSRARWRLTADDIRPLTTARGAARFDAMHALRDRRRLPRWVVLADYDNTLVVDLDNVVAVDSFVQLLHERSEAGLTELYPGPADLAAIAPEGRYVHEIAIPFVHRPRSAAGGSPSTVPRPPSPVHRLPSAGGLPRGIRHALPGSEWVYAKLYTGHATADRLLRDVIGPVSRRLVDRGAVDRWFFIRYADPHHHLRWRLQVSSPARLAAVRRAVDRAAAQLHDAQQIERLDYDTYHREIERYGGPDGMDIAESLFHVDSEAVLDLLAAVGAPGATADTRWQAALLSIDRLLADLGLDPTERLAVVTRTREEWGRRVRADEDVGRQLAKRYRGVRADLVRLLSGSIDADSAMAGVAAVLDQRSALARPYVARLRERDEAGELNQRLDLLADSFVHMHVNRLIRAEQNLHEVVLYDFLVQLYKEQLARRA